MAVQETTHLTEPMDTDMECIKDMEIMERAGSETLEDLAQMNAIGELEDREEETISDPDPITITKNTKDIVVGTDKSYINLYQVSHFDIIRLSETENQ